MSTDTPRETPAPTDAADPTTARPDRPAAYAPGTGRDRYVRFTRDWFDLRLARPQRRMLEALAEHRRTIAVTGNGVGKSFGAGAAGGLAALYCNADTTVNITSGSYGQLDDTIWKPIKSLHRQAREQYDLPGRVLDNTREVRTELDEEWYLKCLSPQYPADLEGRHNRRMIYLIEEADKPGITHEHIDSAESTLTDADDRLLVICNPPTDETNVVHDLIESDDWHTLRFASWDSRNVRVDAGAHPGPKIPGLVDLSEVRESWASWNGEPWPGLETARTAHERRDDLDDRWYRRRAGVMPPEGAAAHRPFDAADVEAAHGRDPGRVRETPTAVGIDVARSGDRTVMVGVHDRALRVHYAERGSNHREQERALADLIGEWPGPEIAVDAVGEGSGLADGLAERFPHVRRFDAGSTAAAETDYRHEWDEALAAFGDHLDAGGAFDSTALREEALIAARTVEFDERHLSSRGRDGARVLQATSKTAIKEELGHSPDYLDAALMAVWADRVDASDDGRAQTATLSW